MITSENYITIPGFARVELGLKGSELMIYSIIYGFAQNDNNDYTGSLQYICDWTGLAKKNVIANISSLIEKGLVIKKEIFINNVKFVSYKTVRVVDVEFESNSEQEKEVEVKSESVPVKKSSGYTVDFDSAWEAYNRKGNKKEAFKRWQALTNEDKEKAKIHIPFYVESNERQFTKDFERYLKDHVFENPVTDYKTGAITFDPDISSSQKYRPASNGSVTYSPYYECYVFIGMDEDMLFDGYNADNRPDGARVLFHNGRGFHVWNATTKKWEKEQ